MLDLSIQTANFPETIKIIATRKDIKTEGILRKILNCVCTEITKNVEQRKSHVHNYLKYEENSTTIDTEILSKADPYDDTLDYVLNMNNTLKTLFKEADDVMLESVDTKQQQVVDSHETPVDDASLKRDDTEQQQPDGGSQELIETGTQTAGSQELLETGTQTDTANLKNMSLQSTQTVPPENFDKESQAGSEPHPEVVLEKPMKIEADAEEEDKNGNLIAFESSRLITDTRQEALTSLFHEKTRKVGKELDLRYGSYVENPFCYPGFKLEWLQFYTDQSYQISLERSKEMDQFNYLPAWNVHWLRRLKELKCEEYLERQSQLWHQIFDSSESHGNVKMELGDLSDISDDELEGPSPKRRKLDYCDTKQGTNNVPDDQRAWESTEYNRMVIAYHIALDHFRQNKQVTPGELLKLVKFSVEREEGETNQNEAGVEGDCAFQQNELTDTDLLMLYKNFRNLSQIEQYRYISFMQTLETGDPERYNYLQNVLHVTD